MECVQAKDNDLRLSNVKKKWFIQSFFLNYFKNYLLCLKSVYKLFIVFSCLMATRPITTVINNSSFFIFKMIDLQFHNVDFPLFLL